MSSGAVTSAGTFATVSVSIKPSVAEVVSFEIVSSGKPFLSAARLWSDAVSRGFADARMRDASSSSPTTRKPEGTSKLTPRSSKCTTDDDDVLGGASAVGVGAALAIGTVVGVGATGAGADPPHATRSAVVAINVHARIMCAKTSATPRDTTFECRTKPT